MDLERLVKWQSKEMSFPDLPSGAGQFFTLACNMDGTLAAANMGNFVVPVDCILVFACGSLRVIGAADTITATISSGGDLLGTIQMVGPITVGTNLWTAIWAGQAMPNGIVTKRLLAGDTIQVAITSGGAGSERDLIINMGFFVA